MSKTETLKEFLVRGGKIKKLATVKNESTEINVRKTTTGPAELMVSYSSAFDVDKAKVQSMNDKQIIDAALSVEMHADGDSFGELSYRCPDLHSARFMFGEKNVSKKKKTSTSKKVDLSGIDKSTLDKLFKSGFKNG
jgi:hypothetical protein